MRRPIDSAQSSPWQRLVPMPVRRSSTSCSETAISSCTAWCSSATMSGFEGTAARCRRPPCRRARSRASSRGRTWSRAVSSVSRPSPVAATSPDTSSHARASTRGASSSVPSSAIRSLRSRRERPSVHRTWSPSSAARLRKQVSLVPVIDRKRPRSSATTLCARETSGCALALLERERAHAGVGVDDLRQARRAGRAGPCAPRPGGSSTSSPVACRRSRSPSKSVSVAPISENSRHGMTKIMRSSPVAW